jgi:hypothetical protein
MKKLQFILLFFVACQSPKSTKIAGVDFEVFKNDRGGCDNKRESFIETLKTNKDALLSFSENQVFATLGRYDFQVLDKKNEKSFVYYLEKGNHCENIQNPSEAQSLTLKFNSVSLVKEVLLGRGNPFENK